MVKVSSKEDAKVKRKKWVECPKCLEPMYWVELGEPEGDFYSCENCQGEFDEELNELDD